MLKIIIIAVVGAVLSISVKETNKTMGTLMTVCVGIVLTYYIVDELRVVLQIFDNDVFDKFKYKSWMQLLFKSIFITYIAQAGAYMCSDLGFESFAKKLNVTARLIICTMMIPQIIEIYVYIIKLL